MIENGLDPDTGARLRPMATIAGGPPDTSTKVERRAAKSSGLISSDTLPYLIAVGVLAILVLKKKMR